MSDLRDFTGKNRRFTGTDSIKTPIGTTGQRVDGQGKLRFNSTSNLMEYYTGTDWKSIDSPPLITGFTINDVGGSTVTTGKLPFEESGTSTIEVIGSLFDTTGASVTFEPEGSGSVVNTQTITRNSANKLTVTVTNSDFTEAGDPYNIKVTNGSGLSASLASALDANAQLVFTNSADHNANIYDVGRGSVSITDFQATDTEGDTITYALSQGSLPSGLSLNTSSGAVTGSTSAVGSDTVTTFTIRATSVGGTVDRQFTITQKPPVITSYTSTGTGTFSVPAGVTAVKLLVVGGGASASGGTSGGGGAGGMVEVSSYPVTPGGSVPYRVGVGSPPGVDLPSTANSGNGPGQSSFFGPITADGGGRGGYDNGSQGGPGIPGGSGGGRHTYAPRAQGVGSATQPGLNPGVSNLSQYGNSGGPHAGSPGTGSGGGGGGAGGAGAAGNGNSNGGTGGAGRASNYSGSSVIYAAGGGGGGSEGGVGGGPGGSSGVGGQGRDSSTNSQIGGAGTANRGSGGGGTWNHGNAGGAGGSGIIIVSY